MEALDASPQRDTRCPVCYGGTVFSGTGQYYTANRRFRTPFGRCPQCDLYIRLVDPNDLTGHINAASYVQLQNEHKFLSSRHDFFDHLLDIVRRWLAKTTGQMLVDFGCSYGHLLEQAKLQGFNTIGIEIAKDVRRSCTERGLAVYESMAELPDEYADVVTFIDSLYCLTNPLEALREAARLLKPSGLVLVRVTNRNWMVKVRKLVGIRDLTVLGDAVVSYSPLAIRYLLSTAGFSSIRMIGDDATGKRIGFRRKVFYAGCAAMTKLLPEHRMLTPGVIAMAWKNARVAAQRRG